MTSVIPVASTSAGQIPVTAAHTTTTASTPSSGIVGVNSSVNSSLSSAATPVTPAAPQGFSAKISACISSVCKAIRNCLAKLPLIGGWFGGSSSSTSIVNIPAPPAPTIEWTDALRLEFLRTAFSPATSSSGATIAEVPNAGTIRFLLGHFRAIQSPAEKIAAFQAVQTAQNSNDEITRQFFDALDEGAGGNAIEASKGAIRYYTYLAVVPDAQGVRSEDFEGRPYTGNLGGHVAGAHPRHDLVRTGVRNLHAALVAQAAAAAASAGSSSSSGSVASA